MKFVLIVNVKLPTTVGILTFMSIKNSIQGLSEPKKAKFLDFFYTYEHSCSTELSMKKSFITSYPEHMQQQDIIPAGIGSNFREAG